MTDTNCPYCDKGVDINHDDGYGYEEGVTHQQECGHCNKIFVYGTSISFYYEAGKADCLNGSKHEYKPTHTVPKAYTQMECEICQQRRPLTKEELKTFNIPNHE